MDGNTMILSATRKLSLDTAVRRVHELSTLPQVALQIIRMVQQPLMGAAELTRAIEGDPALCARLLRCVNSAAYGLRFKINTVQRATAYLGFKTVRNLALTNTISDSFRKELRLEGYSRLGLWQHMVSVAVSARMIARRVAVIDFEEVFLAGLLHDLGLILEDQYLHEQFVAVVESLDGTRPLPEVERQVLGFDHTVYGQRVAEIWKFPDTALAAIGYHHTPETYSGPHERVLACVALAELLCTLKGRPEMQRAPIAPCPRVLEILGLDIEGLKVIRDDLDQEFAEHSTLFQVPSDHE
jgi:putative nucleotidyltransferase with HDIG domain